VTQNEKFQIQRRNTLRNLWQKLSGTPEFPVKLVLAALYLMGAAYVCVKQAAWRTLAGNIPLLSPLLKAAMEHALTAYLLAGAATLPVLLLYPFGRRAAKDQLQCIGLVNHAGMPPDLLRKRRDKDNVRVTVWEFRNQSIPLQEWEKKRLAIETALGITIVKLTYAKGKSRVLVYAVPAGDDLPEVLKWKDSYLSLDSFVLVLGESYTGPVTVNLTHIPHILLGGSTGSGKSVLLKLLLMQALRKGAEVYIADFKGGVDFPKVWHEKCRMCFTEEDLCDTLDRLVEELERRKSALKALGCPNIDAYNEIAERPLQRLIYACDEVAEVLDKTGRSKEDKELLAQIENRLSTIARLGRAFGIHLILATQRPDANIIPGQIKNNMDFRVCGRADSVLSQIILDNTSAAEQIPKDARGRFITGDGTVFQGYLFDEEQI
jgi:S-DNA-T family DNA segregation ATPase FtsK/SpoIIIE